MEFLRNHAARKWLLVILICGLLSIIVVQCFVIWDLWDGLGELQHSIDLMKFYHQQELLQFATPTPHK